jgi:hypothetical protein
VIRAPPPEIRAPPPSPVPGSKGKVVFFSFVQIN